MFLPSLCSFFNPHATWSNYQTHHGTSTSTSSTLSVTHISQTRATLRQRAAPKILLNSIRAENFVIVMSGPEGTNSSLTVEAMGQLRGMGRQARGVVVMDLEQMTESELHRLNDSGVRSVRFNTRRDGTSLDGLFAETAKKLHDAGVCWSIEAAIFDVATWSKLIPTLREANENYGIVFVADHVFAAQVEDLEKDEFKALLKMVDDVIIVVKISGLDRYERNPIDMIPVVKAVLSQRDGKGGVFGRDWPHVDSTPGSTSLMDVDIEEHLSVLKHVCDQLGPGKWEALMRDNAKALYA
jgi:predicted TIM-barrel fold metal-dependent hydrolase